MELSPWIQPLALRQLQGRRARPSGGRPEAGLQRGRRRTLYEHGAAAGVP